MALAAIQAVYRLRQEKDEVIAAQQLQLDQQAAALASLRAELEEAKQVLAQVANEVRALRAQR